MHPQALVYPLTVASKYPSVPRRKAALAIMDKMKSHSSNLVDQALLVSGELIRVAILWHELWHEGLEEASRLFYGDHNIDAMFATLEPLHEMLEKVYRIPDQSCPALPDVQTCRDPKLCEKSLSPKLSVVTCRMRANRANATSCTPKQTILITLGTFTTR